MFDVFKKHRKLKLLGLTLGLLLAWFAIKPAADIINGQSVDESSLVGSYANTAEHQIVLREDGIGSMVSGTVTESFFYEYSYGVIECQGLQHSFQVRVLGNGNLWNRFDGTYLYRRTQI